MRRQKQGQTGFSSCGLKTRRMINKFPGDLEPTRKVRRQRFHAERFGRIMAAVKHIHAQLLRQRIGPMRPFARDKRVHPLGRRFRQLTSGSTSDHPDPFAGRRSTGKEERLDACGALQSLCQLLPSNSGRSPKSDVFAVSKEKRTQLAQAQQSADARVVDQTRM